MSLDERLRTELRAIATGELREDEALDTVVRKHDRGLALGQVTRHAIAAAVVVSLFASVALVITWRDSPERTGAAAASAGDRYRSTARVRIAPAASSASTSTTIDPMLKPADPRALALTPSTRHAALTAARVSPDDIGFLASLDPSANILSLIVTAPTKFEAETVTRRWASAFVRARRDEAIRLLRAASRAIDDRANVLLEQLRQVNAELVRADPATFAGVDLRWHPPISGSLGDPGPRPPAVPPSASTHELDLANERIQIQSALGDLAAEAASTRISTIVPTELATLISQTPAVRVHRPSSSKTAPVLIGWTIGLLVVLAAALFVYRRRTRSLRQVAA